MLAEDMFAGNRTLLLFILTVALLLFREIAIEFRLYHFQPYAALFFCLAALRKTAWLALPLVGYLLSTMIATGGFSAWMLSPLLAFALIAGWGRCFQLKSGALSLLAGSLGGAGIFYLVTNTGSWIANPGYSKTLAGLLQALTTGLPSHVPTWTFFRNDAVATILFTAVILLLHRFPFQKKAEAALPAQA